MLLVKLLFKFVVHETVADKAIELKDLGSVLDSKLSFESHPSLIVSSESRKRRINNF